ncbi:hypothetical protein OJF2_60740 [Aquisphaera giovannonii]|uniref:Uncharacterized protein n=1 Tax=Aquisphaera giovannonii TaxID=406548 RepID=A0A5B9WAB0_9BACT|nr:hypothetical protein [Aquisphaera giovannonii]QEH37483.1 hypothetical protein OJF2_60740 [Aquisphaera giovannonii]
MILAYFGPETVMPVTSIIATAAAMVAMFGKGAFRLVFGGLRARFGRNRLGATASKAGIGIGTGSRPHFSHGHQAGHPHAIEAAAHADLDAAEEPAEDLAA